MAETLRDLKVGDTFVVSGPNRTYRTKVTKIGRRLLHTDRCAFDLDTGLANDRWGNDRAMTVEEYERRVLIDDARNELRKVGVEIRHSVAGEAVLKIREALRGIFP